MRKLIPLQLLFALLILSGWQSLCAQDLHFSQFPWSPLNLGAATTGTMDADLRIAALHRKQWKSVPVPYSTFSIGVEAHLSALNDRLKGWNGGILINQDKAGDGDLQTLQFELETSYSFPINSDSVHFLMGGISLGITQKSLDLNKLTFDNQFNGDLFDPIAPGLENLDRTSYTFADLGLSAGWMRKSENGRIRAGFQVKHLNKPDQSFYSEEKVPLPMMFQLYSSADFPLNDQVTFSPAISWMHQEKFSELNLGAEAKLILKNETAHRYAVGLGLFYRANDALIPLVALYWNKFRFGLSYDINTSAFKKATNGRGGPEFTVVYQALSIRNHAPRKSPCPIY